MTPARKGMNSISAMASRQTRLATASETVGRAAENQFHFTPTSASWLNQVEVWFRSCRGSRLAALQKPQAASGTHRCLRQRVQRQSRALRLDQEKGPSTPFQKPPYHSALIPGTSCCAAISQGCRARRTSASFGPRQSGKAGPPAKNFNFSPQGPQILIQQPPG